jgi:hypothetical protein
MKYKRLQMVCDEHKPDELELLKWVEGKKHGFFSNTTKAYLFELMRKEKEEKQ